MAGIADRILRFARTVPRVAVSRRGLLTFGVAAAGVLAFHASDYEVLCIWTATLVKKVLGLTGIELTQYGTVLLIDRGPIQVTRECLYLGCIFIATPFTWRLRSLVEDVGRTVVFVVVVAVLDFLRIYLSILALVKGDSWSWFWCHDVAAYSGYYGIIALVIALWFRAAARRLQRDRGSPGALDKQD